MEQIKALAWAQVRYSISFVLGTTVAAALASVSGGSMQLLLLYSLAVGLPFFAAASVLGLIFRASVLAHPIAWSVAAPVVTAGIWFGFGLSMGDLFNGPGVAWYAVLCAACSGAAFYFGLKAFPPASGAVASEQQAQVTSAALTETRATTRSPD